MNIYILQVKWLISLNCKKYMCTKHKPLAERDGNKHVNGKKMYIIRNNYIFFNIVWGPFMLF